MRNVYIDLGANVGLTVVEYAKENPGCEIFAVEPNFNLLGELHKRSMAAGGIVHVIWGAAWIKDGKIQLFQSTSHVASTIVQGKVELEELGWPQIDYEKPEPVPCFDFSQWLLRNFFEDDEIVLKVDIEGAEYQVLTKMLIDGSIDLVTTLRCEWHKNRFPHISQDEHDGLVAALSSRVNLEKWG